MPLSVIQQSGGISLLQYEGELRQGVFTPDVDLLESLLGQDCRHRAAILLDLSRTSYIDSNGVGWVVNQHKRSLEARGIFVIHSVPPSVMAVFKLLKLEKYLVFADDEHAAKTLAVGEVR